MNKIPFYPDDEFVNKITNSLKNVSVEKLNEIKSESEEKCKQLISIYDDSIKNFVIRGNEGANEFANYVINTQNDSFDIQVWVDSYNYLLRFIGEIKNENKLNEDLSQTSNAVEILFDLINNAYRFAYCNALIKKKQ